MCIAFEKQTKSVFFALFVQGDQLQVGFFTEIDHVYSSDENTGNIFEEIRSRGKLINGGWEIIIIATNARILLLPRVHELGEDSLYEIRGAVFNGFSKQGAERFKRALLIRANDDATFKMVD